ncbi:Delta(3,5)-Delta(2,4)-dienoyl-CoA isomerase [Thraustotheca clavata]|uniref:Delta(3,5)-Delta(2,4)-dienoyl-CoA isomerase n=1 Tax=Thraustotheca clavata TaxID=74557 RepID=A0A1W0A3Z0_9STRA|nr:Delta(3,5)-Delta(2,4)-dienoyl-CoA isomerase [Thraustotheca clavata]
MIRQGVRRLSTVSNALLLREWIQPASQATKLADLKFETLAITESLSGNSTGGNSGVGADGVLNVRLHRPTKLNAFDMQMWNELETLFDAIEHTPEVRAVVIRGEGRGFSSGMDLNVFASMQEVMMSIPCEARKREALLSVIARFQKIISAPEKCRVPVIAAVHGSCIGGAVDFITACDIRLCDTSAEFSVKEIDLAIVADIGTLQRLPNLVGEQQAKELAYTGRSFFGAEAEKIGLVLKTHVDAPTLFNQATTLAKTIASKSPLTVRGVKKVVQYQRDHSTEDSLAQVQLWNSAMLYSNDLAAAMTAIATKKPPQFEN